MNDLLFERSSPGASTCVIVGSVQGAPLPDLARFRRVLWIVEQACAARGPDRSRVPAALSVEVLEDLPDGSARGALGRLLLHDPRHVPHVCITSGVIHRHAGAYERVVGEVRSIVEGERRARALRTAEGFARQRNLLLNLPALLRRPLPAAWAGALKGSAAFVPGPDAPPDAPWDAAADAVVIAHETALPTLARRGRRADFVVASEPDARGAVADPGSGPTRLVLAGSSDPAWRGSSPASLHCYVRGRGPTEDWLSLAGVPGGPWSSPVDAVGLARFLGCDPVLEPGDPPARHEPGRHGRQADALAGLQIADTAPCAATLAALARLGAIGARVRRDFPRFRRALRGGPESVAARLRTLFADEDLAAAFGSFTRKLRPLLAPPVEGDRAAWAVVLDELEELAALAEALAPPRPRT